jgi:nicotinamide mononucleotide (NMN) deamidase PncC
VYFACATAETTKAAVERYGDIGRQEVRERSILRALDLVIAMLGIPAP